MSAPGGTAPIVVLGDALLDVDLTGRASRLAPDSPVPVLDELEETHRPGGAALAAALLARGGREVVLVTAVADDAEGALLARLVGESGVRLVPVPHDGATTVKRRVRSRGQSLLRLDSGRPGAVAAVPEEAVAAVRSAAGVLVSDYGRGCAGLPELRRAVEELPGRVPVVWDPHPRGARPTIGARLVTPNREEAALLSAAEGAPQPGWSGLAAVAGQAAALVAAWRAHAVCVTLGERGALLSHGETSPAVVPAPRVPVTDPCGAGDRFAAGALAALADGALVPEAVEHAVAVAAAFLADGGAAAFATGARPTGATTEYAAGADAARPSGARPTGARPKRGAGVEDDPVARVRADGGTVVATGGCFDLLHAGHVATLQAARALGDCLVVCLNSDASVRRLKGAPRPLVPAPDRARVLAALEPVDAVVVFDEDTPVEALRRIRPDVWVKGGDYAGAELPEAALLREWGGQAVVVPYLQGRSTTRLVTTASTGADPR